MTFFLSGTPGGHVVPGQAPEGGGPRKVEQTRAVRAYYCQPCSRYFECIFIFSQRPGQKRTVDGSRGDAGRHFKPSQQKGLALSPTSASGALSRNAWATSSGKESLRLGQAP